MRLLLLQNLEKDRGTTELTHTGNVEFLSTKSTSSGLQAISTISAPPNEAASTIVFTD